MANNAVYANVGTYGVNDQPQVGPLMQAQSGVLMLFTLADLTGSAIDLSGLALSGTITNNLTSETAALAGALTIVTAEDGIFSWLTDADDVGTAGEFTLIFQAGEDIISLPAHLSILETPGASVTFGAALMGVTAAERAWLTAALAALPDPSGLANYLPLTGGALTGALQFSGTTHAGLKLNSLSLAQMFAVSPPAEGMLIYNNSLKSLYAYLNGTWVIVPSLTTAQANFLALAGGTMADNGNIATGIVSGTKLATATTQKLGFWNATPVVQQVLATGTGATVDNVITLLQTLGLCRQS